MGKSKVTSGTATKAQQPESESPRHVQVTNGWSAKCPDSLRMLNAAPQQRPFTVVRMASKELAGLDTPQQQPRGSHFKSSPFAAALNLAISPNGSKFSQNQHLGTPSTNQSTPPSQILPPILSKLPAKLGYRHPGNMIKKLSEIPDSPFSDPFTPHSPKEPSLANTNSTPTNKYDSYANPPIVNIFQRRVVVTKLPKLNLKPQDCHQESPKRKAKKVDSPKRKNNDSPKIKSRSIRKKLVSAARSELESGTLGIPATRPLPAGGTIKDAVRLESTSSLQTARTLLRRGSAVFETIKHAGHEPDSTPDFASRKLAFSKGFSAAVEEMAQQGNMMNQPTRHIVSYQLESPHDSLHLLPALLMVSDQNKK